MAADPDLSRATTLLPNWPARTDPAPSIGQSGRPSAVASLLPGWGRWLLLGTLTPAVTALAGVAFWPLWQRDGGLALTMTLLFAALFAIGIVLLAEPGQLTAGAAMIASAVLLVVSWANEWGGGPFPLLSQVFGDVWALLACWVLYRYPDRSLRRWERIMFALMFAWFLLVPWLKILMSQPAWHEFPLDSWWLSLSSDEDLYHVVSRAIDLTTVCFGAVFVTGWVIRLRAASPVERTIKKANSVVAVTAAMVGALIPFARAMDVPEPTMDVLYTIAGGAILAVPVALLVAVLRRQLARTGLTTLLPQLVRSVNTAEIVGVLRRALADPGLDVLPWSDDIGRYVDRNRQPMTAESLAGKLVTRVSTIEGHRLALVITDPALGTDPELVEAAGAAVSLALENTLLIETVRRQLDELQRASQRVVKAGDDERRRLEQDLHDGAQQHFLALGLMIGAAEEMTQDPVARRMLDQMRGQLEHALAELRRLAQGLHPAVLRLGLAVAIARECERLPVPVSVELPDETLPETTTVTAYYAICEALANAVKHAHAGAITVRGTAGDGVLTVEVADDGRGGALVGAGKGLTGIIDRVRALGGKAVITSPVAGGTCLTLTIPCM